MYVVKCAYDNWVGVHAPVEQSFSTALLCQRLTVDLTGDRGKWKEKGEVFNSLG